MTTAPQAIALGRGGRNAPGIPLHLLTRHALVTGQTGTGKTVTLLSVAEQLSRAGVPLLLPDVKGDLSAIARSVPGVTRLDVMSGAAQIPLWDLGADLLGRAMELSEAQAATLEIVFAWADDTAAPLDTLADLRAALARVLGQRDAVSRHYGYVSQVSLGVIQRGVLRLERAGAAPIFGPARFDIAALVDQPGRVTILDATRLFQSPRLYGAVMLWLLRELWRRLPERGDAARPRFALAIDEAHALFAEAGPALLRQTEQTARLIRSKGVALILASQMESDVPAIVAEQCASRIRHDRALGIGRAELVTLDRATGRATAPEIVCPAMPDCGTAPCDAVPAMTLAPASRPADPAAPISAEPWRDAGAIAFAALIVAAPVVGVALIVGAGLGAWLAGVALALGLVFMFNPPRPGG